VPTIVPRATLLKHRFEHRSVCCKTGTTAADLLQAIDDSYFVNGPW